MEAVAALAEGGVNVNTLSASIKPAPCGSAYHAHLDIAKFLLDHGADPKLANDDGLTALYATEDMQWRSKHLVSAAHHHGRKDQLSRLMKKLVAEAQT